MNKDKKLKEIKTLVSDGKIQFASQERVGLLRPQINRVLFWGIRTPSSVTNLALAIFLLMKKIVRK